MSEEVVFQEGHVRVTTSRIEIGDSTYPFEMIETTRLLQHSFEYGRLWGGIAAALVGWGLINTTLFGVGWPLAIFGILAAASTFLPRSSWVTIYLHNGTTVDVKSPDGGFLERVQSALRKARRVV